MNLKRIFLGFALAPLVTPLVFGLVWLVIGTLRFGDFEEMRGVLLLISLFAYSVAILFGVPLTLVIRRRTYSSRIIFTTTGAVVGLLMAAALDFGLNWFGGILFICSVSFRGACLDSLFG
jgi:uncharacterized protein YacL